MIAPPTEGSSGTDHTDASDATLAALACAGATVVPVTVSGRGYSEERRQVATTARRHRVRVAHTHGYRPDVVDAGRLRGVGLPVVTTVHGFTGGNWRNRLYRAFATLVLPPIRRRRGGLRTDGCVDSSPQA